MNSVEYYKRKLSELQANQQQESLPLEEALDSSVDALLTSKQRYKLMSTENISESIAKAVFNNNFANGVALNSIIAHAKRWLRRYVFTPERILKQMDLSGGTLNYEGISILNGIKAASYTGNKTRYRNRLVCTPYCLKRVAKKLESAANELCPFHSYMTPFGEAIEFDYSKTTRLFIDAFGLSEVGKDRATNVTASNDAARLTKNICHTSAGLKMTDPGGFSVDGARLHDMQSQNFIFLLKIVLTKETKDSFKLFDDVFQFF